MCYALINTLLFYKLSESCILFFSPFPTTPPTTAESGDRPRDLVRDLPKEAVAEMASAAPSKDKKTGREVFSMGSEPFWDWDEEKEEWGWTRDAPVSNRSGNANANGSSKGRKKISEHEKALREMSCGLCKSVLQEPVSAPCGHSFCKPCLDVKFGGQAFEHDAGAATGRSLRIRRVVMPCPCCKGDLADFLRTAQVNRDMESMVLKLQKQVEAEHAEHEEANGQGSGDEEEEEEEEVAAGEGNGINDALSSPHVSGKRTRGSPLKKSTGTASTPVGRKNNNPPEESSKSTPSKKQKKETPKSAAVAAVAAARSPAVPAGVAAAVAVGAGPSIVGGAMQSQATENDRNALATATLASEFAEFDAMLVESLMEQEDWDAQAVKMALSRMRNQMQAEERKKAKKARQAEAGGTPSAATAAVPEAASPSPAVGTGSRRLRNKSASVTPKLK